VNYKAIKAIVAEGGHPSVSLLNDAIRNQLGVVAGLVASLSKHAARLMASHAHPFPVAPDQEGRVMRRADALDREHGRLTRLYYWRALAENAFTTAPANSA
jgi:hypothetical protein